MSYFLGIGTGLLLVIILWGMSILLIVVTSRLKPPYSLIGLVSLVFSILVTFILVILPRRAIESAEEALSDDNEEIDWNVYFLLPVYLLLAMITLGLNATRTIDYIFQSNKSPVVWTKTISFNLPKDKRRKGGSKKKMVKSDT